MKFLTILLVTLFLLLQYKLWVEEGGVAQVWRLNKEVASQQFENDKLQERNVALVAEVKDLKKGNQAIEERARSELGMVKKGEVFYQVVGR